MISRRLGKEKGNRLSIKNCCLFWRRRRDSNPRTAFDGYTISNRAPSTKLGDFSKSNIPFFRLCRAQTACCMVPYLFRNVNCFLYKPQTVFPRCFASKKEIQALLWNDIPQKLTPHTTHRFGTLQGPLPCFPGRYKAALEFNPDTRGKLPFVSHKFFDKMPFLA